MIYKLHSKIVMLVIWKLQYSTGSKSCYNPFNIIQLEDYKTKCGCPPLLGRSPLGFLHEGVGLHDDVGLQSKSISRPLFGLHVVAKAKQTGHSVPLTHKQWQITAS